MPRSPSSRTRTIISAGDRQHGTAGATTGRSMWSLRASRSAAQSMSASLANSLGLQPERPDEVDPVALAGDPDADAGDEDHHQQDERSEQERCADRLPTVVLRIRDTCNRPTN